EGLLSGPGNRGPHALPRAEQTRGLPPRWPRGPAPHDDPCPRRRRQHRRNRFLGARPGRLARPGRARQRAGGTAAGPGGRPPGRTPPPGGLTPAPPGLPNSPRFTAPALAVRAPATRGWALPCRRRGPVEGGPSSLFLPEIGPCARPSLPSCTPRKLSYHLYGRLRTYFRHTSTLTCPGDPPCPAPAT